MAILGRWTGAPPIAIIPTTSWAAPNGMFPTQQRNDSSAYSFNSTTSTLTLPSSDLADGYLIVASFEFEDSSNGRHQPQAKLVQTGGTGNFRSAFTSGFNRDTSEDRAFVRTFGIVDGPSASATFQMQWKRDTDTPTGGIIISSFDVIPLFYSNIAIYTSTSAAVYGGTTRGIVTGWSNVVESDTNAIERVSDVITCKGDNKKYLVLGSYFLEGTGNSRTQRWGGLDVDGSQENAAKAYTYYRNSSNDEGGEFYTHLLETSTANVTLESYIYRGDGVGAGQGGADSDGGSTPTVGEHCLAVIELNDSAEAFHSVDGTGGVDLNVTGPVDQSVCRTSDITFNDSSSFTRASDTAMNCVGAFDGLFGANVSAAQEVVSTTSRWTARAHFTLNGTEDDDSRAGDYCRNNQGSIDTFGWSANLLSFIAVSDGDDVGVSVQELSGGEDGGQLEVQPGWSGFWGINLDSLQATGSDEISQIPTGSLTLTGLTPSASTTENVTSELPVGALTLTSSVPNVTATENVVSQLSAGSIQLTGLVPSAVTTEPVEDYLTGPDGEQLTGPDGEILTGPDQDLSTGEVAEIPLGSITLTGLVPNVATTENVVSELPLASLQLNGNAPSVITTENITSELPVGALSITGIAPQVVTSESITAELPLGSLTLTALAPSVSTSENVTSQLPAGSLNLNGLNPSVATTENVQSELPLGNLSLTGLIPSVSTSENVVSEIPLGNLTLTANAPSVSTTENITSELPLGSIQLTGLVPNAVTGDGQIAQLPLGSLTITGYAPTVTFNEEEFLSGPDGEVLTGPDGEVLTSPEVLTSQVSQLPSGSIELTGFAPSVTTSENVTSELPQGTINLVGNAPSIETSENVTSQLPLGQLELTGNAPSVVVTDAQISQIPLGTLQLQGFAPQAVVDEDAVSIIPLGEIRLVAYRPSVFVTDYFNPANPCSHTKSGVGNVVPINRAGQLNARSGQGSLRKSGASGATGKKRSGQFKSRSGRGSF